MQAVSPPVITTENQRPLPARAARSESSEGLCSGGWPAPELVSQPRGAAHRATAPAG